MQKLRVFGRWEGYKCNGSKVESQKPCFQVRKHCRILGGGSSCEVTVRPNEAQSYHYRIQGLAGKSTFKIVNSEGGVMAEVKQKQTSSGVVLGDDVLDLVVEPHVDHSLVMALVAVCGLIHHRMWNKLLPMKIVKLTWRYKRPGFSKVSSTSSYQWWKKDQHHFEMTQWKSGIYRDDGVWGLWRGSGFMSWMWWKRFEEHSRKWEIWWNSLLYMFQIKSQFFHDVKGPSVSSHSNNQMTFFTFSFHLKFKIEKPKKLTQSSIFPSHYTPCQPSKLIIFLNLSPH